MVRAAVRGLLSLQLTLMPLLMPVSAGANDPVDPAPAPDDADDRFWEPQLYVEGWLGSQRNVGDVELVMPLYEQRDRLWFGTVRGRADSESSHESNFGFGYRQMLNEGEQVFGVYGAFDLLYSAADNRFAQVTLGSEYSTRNWEFRLNSYVPEVKKADAGPGGQRALIDGTSIVISNNQLRERALPGLDVEIGRRVELKGHAFWFFGGAYHFNASDYPDVTGPRFRVATKIPLPGWVKNAGLQIGGEWQTDQFRGSQGFASLQIRIHPGSIGRSSSWAADKMVSRIRRDVDVVTSNVPRPGTLEPAYHAATGRAYSGIYFAEAGGAGSGTHADPTDLAGASAMAGPDSVIVANGASGQLGVASSVVRDGSTLIGGGSRIQVATATGQLKRLRIPGSRGSIRGTSASSDVVVLANGASDVLIANVDIDGGDDGIRGSNNARVRIADASISNTGRRGILLNSPGSVELSDVTVSNAVREGVYLNRPSGDVTLEDVHIDATGRRGLYAFDSGGDVRLSRVDVTGAGNRGVDLNRVAGSVDIEEVRVTNAAREGVMVARAQGPVRISQVDVQSAGFEGIEVTRAASSVRIEDVDVTGSGRIGLYVDRPAGAVEFEDLRVTGSARQGIYLRNAATTASFTDVTLAGSGRDGLLLANPFGAVSLQDVSIEGSGNEGLQVDQARSTLTADRLDISNSAGIGVFLNRPRAASTFTNTRVDNSGLEGLRTNNASGSLTWSGGSILQSGREGVEISNNTAAVSLLGLRIDGAARQGLYLRNTRAGVTLDSLNIANTGREGLFASTQRAALSLTNSSIAASIGRRPVFVSARGSFAIDISDNQLGPALNGSNAIWLRVLSGDVSANISNNTALANGTGFYIEGRGGITRLTLASNRVTGTTRGLELRARRTVYADLLNNRFDGQLRARTINNAAVLCADVRGNAAPTGILLRRQGSSQYDLVDRNGVSAANPSPVTFSPNLGAFGDVVGCP